MTAIARLGEPKHTYAELVNRQAPKGGTLRLATTGTFDSLNNLVMIGVPLQYMALTYETLMYRVLTEPFSLYAQLAEKVEIAPNNSHMIVYLNPKACFHNGDCVTTADVKATLDTLMQKGLPRFNNTYKNISKVIIHNIHKIEFQFKSVHHSKPDEYNPELPLSVALLPVFSKKQLDTLDFSTSGLTPLMGTGPYRVKEVDQGRKIVFEKNKNYWGRDLPISAGRYNFDYICIEYFKNANALFQGFFAKLFDIYFETNPQQWLHNYDHKLLKSKALVKQEIHHQRPVMVRTIIMNARRPVFKDIALRRALVLAFDAYSMNKLFFGTEIGTPHSLFQNTELAHSGVPSLSEKMILDKYKDQMDPHLYNRIMSGSFDNYIARDLVGQRRNLEEAADILRVAGYKVHNGICCLPNGKPLVLHIMIKDEKLEKVVLTFRARLKELGIQLRIQKIDANQYESNVLDSNFDMIIHQWSNSLSPGTEQGYFFGQKTAHIKGSSNYIGLQDPVAEGLALEINQANTRDQLVTATRALDRYVMHLCYNIPLSYDNKLRIAYWRDLVAFPALNEKHDMDIMTRGWSVKSKR